MTGLINFSGPHWSTFGMPDLDLTWRWFRDALMTDGPIDATPARSFTDGPWYLPGVEIDAIDNDGHWVIQPGTASGPVVGGNLCTFNLLQGTTWMPSLDGAVVVVEDDLESSIASFDRDLTSLTHQPGFDRVRALLIGRFQVDTGMDRDTLTEVISNNRALADLPVIANLDIGHTDPMLTFPIGGTCHLSTHDGDRTDIMFTW